MVYVRTTGCHTKFVAEKLAQFAGIPARNVAYAGLKNRNAVTEQWFVLHIPGKVTPDFSQFALEGCEVVQVVRHNRKVRTGALRGNHFTLLLRDLTPDAALEQRLQAIAESDVLHSFGAQRFGRDGNNLQLALR
ncbi:tRNA pseudouridine(13) synthase TruD, partial [Plesiomonas shigelloides]|nr:tRNA pseudouridine(13) synthase TruD [Plesiomonas shigelloides]